jgi:hypothetical protein
MPDEVCARHAELRQQPPTVVRLGRETRSVVSAVAGVAAAVVRDQPIPIGERALGEQRREGIGDERPVDENDRLAGSDVLVFQRGSRHAP